MTSNVITETADRTAVEVRTSGTTLSNLVVQGAPTSNGRGITIMGAKNVRVLNVECKPSGDDAFGGWGEFRGLVVIGYQQHQGDWSQWNHGVVLGNEPGQPQPNWGIADGYAATFYDCWFEASMVPIRSEGGVYQAFNCDIVVSPLGGIDARDARWNLVNCRFRTMPSDAKPPYGYNATGPCPIRVQSRTPTDSQAAKVGKTRIYSAGCTLDGRPVTTAELCRLFNYKTGYLGPGSASGAIRKTPNY